MSYQTMRTLVKVPYTKTIKGEYKEFRGFTYIISFLKSAYGINVYNGSNIQDKFISKINSLINEYNNDYTSKKWITEDIKRVCNPDDNDFKCEPKVIFEIKDIPLLNGRLRVKNKLKAQCDDKCGPDCKDNCFYVPKLTINPKDSKFFSNTINNCSCLPCFEYITLDGDIKCFQKDIVPEILQILLDNFKKIFAASNDSNPRTAYYIFVDTFDNETEDVDDDVRRMVSDLQSFITKCKNPSSSNVQKECEDMNRSKEQANSSCENSKKIFCKNISSINPNADEDNCIQKEHGFIDVFRDNINYYLKPTISDSCYCVSINPIDGSEITDEEKWMRREKCNELNYKSSNFHICNDDSYAIESIKQLRNIKNNCADKSSELCKDNTSDGKDYDSYTFDFSYNGTTNLNNCNDENRCYIYKNDKTVDEGDDEKSINYNDLVDNVKENSIFKYSVNNYCYCRQPKDQKKCNTFKTCFVGHDEELESSKSCTDVHEEIFGTDGKLTAGMSSIEKELAQNNIIDRNICENKLRCLGYLCENGGYDNPHGSKYENNNSYMSYVRDFFKPITPSYTGLSLNYKLWDQITIPSNGSDQKIEISTKSWNKAFTGNDETLTTSLKSKVCDSGNVLNQYSNIDAKMAKQEEDEMEKEKESMSQIYDISNYVGCAEGELSNVGKWTGNFFKGVGGSIENTVTFGAAHARTDYSSSLKTPKGCSNLANGYSNFLTNIRSYTSNLIDSEENRLVSNVLGTISNSLSNNCPTDEDNKPYLYDYSSMLGYFIYFIFIISSLLAVFFIGPFVVITLSLVVIFFFIYDKIFSSKNNIDDVTGSAKFDVKYVLGFLIIAISIILLKRTKYGRKINEKGFKIINENISK